MYLKRNIDNALLEWKMSDQRKPLIIRGARQVGKTSSVKNLAKHFKYFAEINFDENPTYVDVFSKGLSVFDVCEQISALTNTPIVAGETLLFLDEIQSSVPAISMLRFFYEKMPDLHLIAAGSLLEFALAEVPSFGVGRVRSIFMFPLSFSEFLMSMGEDILHKQLKTADVTTPFADPIHKKLVYLYKKFLIIGGMPEAINVYVETKDLLRVQRVLDDLIISMQADFVKYKARVPSSRLLEVFNAIAQQVATKFTYTYPNSTLNNNQIKEAIELLKMAGIIYSVTHSAANGIPLGAEINPKKTKYLIFDTGIFQRILGLNIAEMLINDDFTVINKGNIAELHVGIELLKEDDCYKEMSCTIGSVRHEIARQKLIMFISTTIMLFRLKSRQAQKGVCKVCFYSLREKTEYRIQNFT
jgi:predicted AAA+ superfamily ATPase